MPSSASAYFEAVFGGNARGLPKWDLSKNVTDTGPVIELERLHAAIAADDFESVYAAMSRHRSLYLHLGLSAHPALEALVRALAVRVCEREAFVHTEVTRTALRASGVAYVDFAKNIVYDAGHKRLHIWPDGDRVECGQRPSNLSFEQTMCGENMDNNGWMRARRGLWGRCINNADAKANVCEVCATAAVSTLSDFDEDDSARFFSRTRTAAAAACELEDTYTAVRLSLMESDAFSFMKKLQARTQEKWRQRLVTDLAEFAYDEGPWVVCNLIDSATAFSLLNGREPSFKHYQRWANQLTFADWCQCFTDVLPAAEDLALNPKRARWCVGPHSGAFARYCTEILSAINS